MFVSSKSITSFIYTGIIKVHKAQFYTSELAPHLQNFYSTMEYQKVECAGQLSPHYISFPTSHKPSESLLTQNQ